VSYNFTLSAILRSVWLIQPEWAIAHFPIIVNIIKGNNNPLDATERTGNQANELPFVIDPKNMDRYDFLKFDYSKNRLVSNPNIPENSVGVLPIGGPITKYNGSCGEPGAIQKASWLGMMQKRDNIGSVVMLMDTPGGEVRAAPVMTDTIGKMGKPVLSLVDDLSASLGMWLSSASDEVYASSNRAQIGSIGSYTMLADMSGMLEKEGIKIHEIYAPQSVDKNKEYRDALKGDYTAIEKDLALHVDDFKSFIKQQRPQSAPFESQWGTGKVFYADEGKKLGLIDGVKSFDQVVSKAAWLGKRNK
jgi:protease-4